MKIAIYVPSWPPGDAANGIVTYASQLVPALRQIGHEVFVLTHATTVEDDDPFTIDVRRFASIPTFIDRAKFRLRPETAIFHSASSALVNAVRELVYKHQIEIFEMEESYGSSFAISSSKLLPVVVRLHGPWFLNGRFDNNNETRSHNYHRLNWERRGIHSAQFVTAPSAEVLQAVKEHYNLTLPASRVIPNPLEASVARETWNVDTCGRDRILFVGRFDRRKGGDLVLRAFGELAASNPDLKLTFVGPDIGLMQANGETWNFDRFVRECLPDGCQSRIEFYGQIKHSEVMALRPKHFVTLIASQYEPFGYSVLEAMSVGGPVIATAVGGIPELIQDHRNGLLVPSQDANAIAVACKKLLDAPTLAARLGRQAWLDCCQLYRPDNVARQTIAAYEEAIYTFNGSVAPNRT